MESMGVRKFFKKYKWDCFAVLLILLSFPLFFYKLGQSSLVSFDEAWYAGIAKNILIKGNPFTLEWNGTAFTDHPPLGFWLMAISFAAFGINEFSARFVQASLGLSTLIIVYFLGKELFNKTIGFISGIALASSPWFLFRARSGNLDAILTFFFILSLYLSVSSSRNKKYLTPLGLSLVFLFLTKSLIPFIILVPIWIIFWGKVKLTDLKQPLVLFLLPVVVWFSYQIISKPYFLTHYLKIGAPGIGLRPSFFDNISLMKTYLHNGIGKWFWPGIFAILLGFFTFQKRFLFLSVFFISFFTPFLFSPKGQIWHLIPLHPILILSFFGFSSVFLNAILKKKILVALIIVIVGAYVSYFQARRNWYEFIDIPSYISDEAILSKEAANYSENFYIDDLFGPAAAFYSGKNVHVLDRGQIKPLFESDQKLILITRKWRLNEEGIPEEAYEIIKTDRDKMLIRKR